MKNCIDCGIKIKNFYSKRCKKCWYKYNSGKNHILYKPPYRCIDCGKIISQDKNYKRCKKCWGKSIRGKNNHNYKESAHPKCIDCGKKLSQGAKKRCIICHMKQSFGEQNPNWKGGTSSLPYPLSFNNKFRQTIRERDNFTCQLCGLLEKNEYQGKNKTNLVIHHIDYIKEHTCRENCISLCHYCNSRVNFNRKYWIKYFLNLIISF